MNQRKLVVSSQWLAQNLDNPSVVIVDCRFQLSDPQWGYQQYYQSHIPGAYYLDLNRDLSREVELHGGRHPLPDVDLLAQKFAKMGIITNKMLVVVYDDSRFAFATRLWWLLRYLGHQSVVLLDGGWQQWQQQGYSVDNKIPAPVDGSFIPQIQTGWTVDIETVKARKDLPDVILVDSRDPDRFAGKIEPIDPIAGSIPGAVNSFWKEVSDEQGYLLPLQRQQKLWSSHEAASEIIVYCGSGVTACVNLFSLELAGLKNTKLYPGGWSDWCSYLE
jgi:thiosulfate/3-mercaptopyruvate sulfurtransferase